MPVYPDLNAAFVHVPKTAGGAIEHHLARWALPKAPGPVPRLMSHLPVAQPLDRLYLRGHDTAAWMRTKLGAALWDGLLTFAVVRNPYDRIISGYEFVRQRPDHPRNAKAVALSFEEWVAWRGGKESQAQMLVDRDGRRIVDRVVAFERLDEELPPLLRELGVPERLPEATKGMNSSEKRPPADYLTPGAIAAINRHAAADFDLLGYRRIARADEHVPRDPPAGR